jgi:glycogen synthase
MKILLSSHFFYPSVGGIEQVSLALAREFSLAGHLVKVVTSTGEGVQRSCQCQLPLASGDGESAQRSEFGVGRSAGGVSEASSPGAETDRRVDEGRIGVVCEAFPFEVIRRPTAKELFALVQWCELFFHNNVSLRMAWPLLIIRRPWVIAHHTWIAGVDGRVRMRDRGKQLLLRLARNIAVSQAIADHLTVPSVIIGNPCREDVFFRDPSVPRDRDLIFVGRLVSDKGVDLLLEAILRLRERLLFPNLTIVGGGPELEPLQVSAKNRDLSGQVEFAGVRTGPELGRLLNRHRTIVVPSRWKEPFGLVALEGIACGCRAIVASQGGLPEAMAPLVVSFERGNVAALAGAIERTLTDPFDWVNYWRAADEIVSQYRAREIASRYLAVLRQACKITGP